MSKSSVSYTLLASQSLSAGSTVRSAVLDCTTSDAGIITAKITNGFPGPTVQATIRLLFAHKQGSVPSAAAEGTSVTDWKIVAEVGAGTANYGTIRFPYSFGPEKGGYFHIEFGGNTAQAVTVEAYATLVTYT